jgi:hypothetical protein
MKRLLVLAAALLCLTAPVANAYQKHLAWDDCGGAGTTDNNFACTNTPAQFIVSSFNAPSDFNNFVGATTELIIGTNGALPPWWRMEAGTGCTGRAGIGMTSVDGANFAGVGCENTWAVFTTPNLTLNNYESNYGANPARARFIADLARSDTGIPLAPGSEQVANLIQLSVARSTGTGVCTGCQEPACLVTLRMNIVDGVAGEFREEGTAPYAFVTWHGGAITGGGCPNATPTKNATWGSVKSLYR